MEEPVTPYSMYSVIFPIITKKNKKKLNKDCVLTQRKLQDLFFPLNLISVFQ